MLAGSPRRRRVAVVALIAAAAALLAGGCKLRGVEAPVVVAFDDLATGLDPHLQNQGVDWSVLGNIYDGLLRFSPSMELEPSLAVSWEMVDDRTWLIGLRAGVRFHDGSILGADDVVASLKRARTHPRSLVKHYLVGVEDVTKLDDLSVEIRCTGPAPDLLNRLTFVYIVPRADAQRSEIDRPIGTGPYRFVSRDADGPIMVEAVQGWRGLPEISSVRFVFFESGQVGADELLAGRVDLLHIVPDDRLVAVSERPGLYLEPQPRLAVQMLALNPAAAPGRSGAALADPRVRQALLMGLNRSAWTSTAFRGNATVASQYVHPVVFGYDPTMSVVPYDPDAARRLLQDAGYEDGFDVVLGHGYASPAAIGSIVSDLGRIGVRVDEQAEPFGQMIERGRRGEVPILFYAFACSTGDASDFLNSSLHSRSPTSVLGSENYSGYSDRETDALIELAEVEKDPATRRKLLQDAQRRGLQAGMVLPLTTPWAYLGVSSRIVVEARHDDRIWVAGYRYRK